MKYRKISLNDLNKTLRNLILKIDSDLHDFCLYHDNQEYVDMDFYFNFDPLNETNGYLGYCIEEFIKDSDTRFGLEVIRKIVMSIFNINFKEGV